MVKKFRFESTKGFIQWYFSQCYVLIDKKYKSPFVRNAIKSVTKGIEKGIIESLETDYSYLNKTPPENPKVSLE